MHLWRNEMLISLHPKGVKKVFQLTHVLGCALKNDNPSAFAPVRLLYTLGPTQNGRHHAGVIMMTSSNGNIFRVTGLLCGEFTGPGEFPAQWPVTRIFDVFFDLRLNKRLSKQPWGWWFRTPPSSLWRQCNDIILIPEILYFIQTSVQCVQKIHLTINQHWFR